MPVRVCQRCCVAARKAHAKMVEERQRRRLNSDGSRQGGGAGASRPPRLRSASSGSSYAGRSGERRASANAASTAAMATAMYFHQLPTSRPRHHDVDAHHDGDHYDDGFYDDHDILSDDGGGATSNGARRHGGSNEAASRLQTLPGELVLTRAERVRIRLIEGYKHYGTLYVTTYRVVFSPQVGVSPEGVVNDNTHTRWGVAAIPTREDELPFTSDLRSAPITSYQAIPLLTIERAKKKETAETDRGVIDIVCKDFRRVQFEFDGLISKQTFGAFDRAFQLIRQYALGEASSHGNSNDPSRSPIMTPRRYPGDGIRGNQSESNDYFCFAKHSREYFPPPPPRAGAYIVDSDDDWHDGWQLYDPVAELERMGVTATSLVSSPSSRSGVPGPSQWRISESNRHYELCPTYPASLAVPAAVSDAVLVTAAKFRSKSRIPVLAWRDKRTGAVICRSSQPLVGLGQKQCDKDVFLIQAIAASNPSSSKMIIIDARPWKNAVAQKTVGRAGYELTEQYETRHATASLKFADMVASEQSALTATTSESDSGDTVSSLGNASPGNIRRRSAEGSSGVGKSDAGARPSPALIDAIDPSLVLTECKLIFMGIENIHAMRKSYNKLQELCCPSPANIKASTSNEKWLEQLASTRWIEHISRILDSAVEIVRVIKEQRASVLVHCSDGWDRTAQLTALAEIMLDPYYRTIRGFQVLVEKEWCSFGHKFRERLGHRTRGKSSGGASSSGINASSGGGPSSAASTATAALSSTLSQSEVSPVFLQWIDCVWQLLMQFPCAFEFNERYLMIVLDHLYSCRFGTFLYDSERERVREEARRPTVSLWTYLRTVDRSVIENPFYYGTDKRGFVQRRRPASIIATRQCFEAGATREREGAVLYPDLPPFSLDSSSDQGDNSICDGDELTRDRNSFLPRSTIVMPRPESLSSESSVSSSSFGFDSTLAVASSTSDSRVEDADEFEALVGKLNTGLEQADISQIENDGTHSSSVGSSDDDQAIDSADSLVADELTYSDNSSLTRYHRIVRDLDSGFTFPQTLDEVSGVSDTLSSTIPSSAPLRVRTRGNFDSPTSPVSTPTLAVPPSPVFPGGSRTNALPISPPRRPSLSSLFVPLVDRPPLSSGGGVAVSSDDADDIITPNCAVKSLRFWSRYYLRWDPTVGGGDRDAGVELEAMHRDLQRECGVMSQSLSNLRRELRRIYKESSATASSAIPDRRHSEPISRKTTVRRVKKASRTPQNESLKVSVKASPIEDEGGALNRLVQQNGLAAQPPLAKSSRLQVNIAANGDLADEASSSSRRILIENQIARLREQKQERMAMVEKSFDAQIARLLQQQEELKL